MHPGHALTALLAITAGIILGLRYGWPGFLVGYAGITALAHRVGGVHHRDTHRHGLLLVLLLLLLVPGVRHGARRLAYSLT